MTGKKKEKELGGAGEEKKKQSPNFLKRTATFEAYSRFSEWWLTNAVKMKKNYKN